MILLIFANCVTLALYRPLERDGSEWNAALQTAGGWVGAWLGGWVGRWVAVVQCTLSPCVVLVHSAWCVSLTTKPPPPPRPDLAINIAFTVEMVLRIASMGGVLPYLSQPWNVFDCIMVRWGWGGGRWQGADW